MTENSCPVIPHFEASIQDARQLARSLRRLKKAMKACQNCPIQSECQTVIDFNNLFAAAIQEVTEEWGIVAYE